jgi:diguanylate cyclase (GGDEF)-like protein
MSNFDLARELSQLRALSALSRDLLQTDDAMGSLALVGRTLADQVRMDSAVLIVHAAGAQYIVGYDSAGTAQRWDSSHPLCQEGEAALRGVRTEGPRPPGAAASMAVAVPAVAPVAALVVQWDRDGHGPRDARLLAEVAALALAALGKIQTRDSLEQLVWNQYAQMSNTAQEHAAELARRDAVETEIRALSMTDVMTGLRNRRGFFMEAGQTFKVARRQHATSAVIFADIDGLKLVNDEFGHAAGDRLIRDAAGLFRASFRNADVVGRLGGDEFAAFTLNDEHPRIVLERIRRHLHAFNLMEERPYRLSLSTGIVQCDPAAELSLVDYVAVADHEMYEHKRRRLH